MVIASLLFFTYLGAVEDQKERLLLLVSDVGEKAAANNGVMPSEPPMVRFFDERAEHYKFRDKPIMFMLNAEGAIIQQFPPLPLDEVQQIPARLQDELKAQPHVLVLERYTEDQPYLVGVYPMKRQDAIIGYALYVVRQENAVEGLFSLKFLRIGILFTLFLCGWIVIYLLTGRLVRPIREAADAAKQIVAGNYNVQINRNHPEKEVYELMHAFKEMADRLHRLESLRKELLAGVTHELKTPVTSISGFVQAVKEGIVTGEEADEFMAMCLKECNRLQKMVEDLLDFNTFAVNVVTIHKAPCNLKDEVAEMLERWQHGQEGAELQLEMEASEQERNWTIRTDAARLEQILINLLNNASAAMNRNGMIYIRLFVDRQSSQTVYFVEVQDTGHGIPLEEQEHIFEPFYRGTEKKTRVRGMGLGLSFSRMIARTLGGDLRLTSSHSEGTCFTIELPEG